ncbi:hypothetical protein K439DRAFT_208733 [Ramaria rubella]|nr:hypothetical protein K439DRAFT_208733 [Ramaria rubella]
MARSDVRLCTVGGACCAVCRIWCCAAGQHIQVNMHANVMINTLYDLLNAASLYHALSTGPSPRIMLSHKLTLNPAFPATRLSNSQSHPRKWRSRLPSPTPTPSSNLKQRHPLYPLPSARLSMALLANPTLGKRTRSLSDDTPDVSVAPPAHIPHAENAGRGTHKRAGH